MTEAERIAEALEKARPQIKDIINSHVSQVADLNRISLAPIHPGPTADAILQAVRHHLLTERDADAL